MILPNKYIMLSESFLGMGAMILDVLGKKNMTIDKLWTSYDKKYVQAGKLNSKPTYQKYIYVLEFMYLTNMITYNEKGEIINENLKPQNN